MSGAAVLTVTHHVSEGAVRHVVLHDVEDTAWLQIVSEYRVVHPRAIDCRGVPDALDSRQEQPFAHQLTDRWLGLRARPRCRKIVLTEVESGSSRGVIEWHNELQH